MNKYMKLDDSSRLNFGQMFRVRPEPNSMMATVVRYLLIVANSLILADAIFLLISEKDEYQGQFIKGRHPVSKYLLLMLYLDIQSFLLIIYGVLGIVATRKRNESMLYVYATLMAIMALVSLDDLDAAFGESLLAVLALVYALMARNWRSIETVRLESVSTIAC